MIASISVPAMTFALAGLAAPVFFGGSTVAATKNRAPAVAAAARPARAEQKPPTIPKGSVRIVNRDSSALLSLSLASGEDAPDVVAQGLPSGSSVIIALPKAEECVYDIEAQFEDWSWISVPSYNLCQDQTLNIGESESGTATEPPKPAVTEQPKTAPATGSAAPIKAAPASSARAKAIATRLSSSEENQPPKSRGRILIENHRHASLLTLLFTVRGESPHLVAQLVASGASVTVGLPEAGKCVYDVQADFGDNYGTSLPATDLCKEPTLKFTE